jgi:hypothetical protein
MSCRAYFLIVILSGLAWPWNEMAAANSPLDSNQITIEKFHGEIYWRAAFSSRWNKVTRKIELPPNALVRVNKDSALTITVPPNSISGAHTDRNWNLTISDPTMFTARADIIRKMILERVYMPKLIVDYKPAEIPDKIIKKSAARKFGDAWNLVIPDFPPGNGRIGAQDEEMPEFLDESLAAKAKRIELSHPRDKSLLYAPGRLLSFKVNWRPDAGADSRYYVRLWRKGDKTAPVVGVTDDGDINLKIDESGYYYLRVETSDGLWISKIHRFEAHVGPAGSYQPTLSDQIPESLEFSNVVEDTLVCLPSERHSYAQSFILARQVPTKSRGMLVIEGVEAAFPDLPPDDLSHAWSGGREIYFERSRAWHRFKPGKYYWQIFWNPSRDLAGKPAENAPRSRVFKLEVTRECPNVADLLNANGRRRVFYAEKS